MVDRRRKQIIYRVDHLESATFNCKVYCGPYSHGTLSAKLGNAHRNPVTHPVPWRDIGVDIGYHFFCGFVSMEHLRKWFDGWLKQLGDQDFCIREYVVHKVKKNYAGGHTPTGQCIFHEDAIISSKVVVFPDQME